MENNDTSLVQIAQNEGLAENKIQTLMNSFADSFAEAKQLANGAKDINVTSEDQVDEMGKARSLRLSLKEVRVNVEKTRKELKEQSLREGKAIDGMANIIKALIVPVEEHLEEQEKFAERKKALRDMEREKTRHDELAKYVENADIYSLHPDNLSEDSFQQMLNTAKIAFEATQEAKKKAEEERVAKEEAEKKEQERIRLENEALKKQQQEREAEIAKERAEQQKKLDAEKLAKEKAERELREKEETERKEKEEKERIAREQKEAEEAEKRKQMMAPDKDKLMKLATEIDELRDHQMPSLVTPGAQAISLETVKRLRELSEYIRKSSEGLGNVKN